MSWMRLPPYAKARARSSCSGVEGKRARRAGAIAVSHAASMMASCASAEYAAARAGTTRHDAATRVQILLARYLPVPRDMLLGFDARSRPGAVAGPVKGAVAAHRVAIDGSPKHPLRLHAFGDERD